MANADVQEQLAETMYFMAAAIPLVSALAVIASYSNSAAEAAYAATRQSAQAAALELATTASSVTEVLRGQPSEPIQTRNVNELLRAVRLLLDQNPGAPVVT